MCWEEERDEEKWFIRMIDCGDHAYLIVLLLGKQRGGERTQVKGGVRPAGLAFLPKTSH